MKLETYKNLKKKQNTRDRQCRWGSWVVLPLKIQNSFEHIGIDNINNKEIDDGVVINETPKSKRSIIQPLWTELQ